ncbi:prepilin peptidase [Streptomyces sp. NPDC050560]|uniref:prepilin peptidase n=1 Tax=Streptomyces sp. NPDC050560 TaxID=3365630 RepID=UPI00379249DD
MHALLTALAVIWGAAAGLLAPRAAYRLAVEPDGPRRVACPEGRPLEGPLKGWLGLPRCPGDGEKPLVGAPDNPNTPPNAPGAPVEDPSTAPEHPGTPLEDPSTLSKDPIPQPHCTRPHYFGPRAPVAAAVTAVVCGALAFTTGPRPELAAWLPLAPVAVLLALVDQASRRLPDVLTWPLACGTVALLGLAALLPGSGGSWTTALLGALALGAVYLVLVLANPAGLGLGDAKLALTLGASLGWYGWTVLVGGAVTGLALGALYGWTQVALRRLTRKDVAPLGPSLLAGALAWLLLGGLAA